MAHHLTMNEREIISQMQFSGHPKAEIARRLGRAASTIGRELKRNGDPAGYSAVEAQHKADKRRRERPRIRKMQREEVSEYVRGGLALFWSPDQIAGRLRVDFPRDASCHVSHQTIYTWIKQQGDDREHWESFLRFGRRRPQRDRRGHIPCQVEIKDRPKVVDRRGRYGDWEGDTVVGKAHSGALVTLVERKSGYLMTGKVTHRRADPVCDTIEQRLNTLPRRLRRTLTLDNGKEFSEHRRLTANTGTKVYFARPYCSWERGANENINGLLRQFFPKGTDFREVRQPELDYATELLNDRPRKRLGYRTPNDIFTKQLCCN